jgi:hypothetical protein
MVVNGSTVAAYTAYSWILPNDLRCTAPSRGWQAVEVEPFVSGSRKTRPDLEWLDLYSASLSDGSR